MSQGNRGLESSSWHVHYCKSESIVKYYWYYLLVITPLTRESQKRAILAACQWLRNMFIIEFITGAQMEPPSQLISWVNPFPSRFINRTASFPRKVSYFRESRVSPWKNKIGWSRTQKPVLRPFSFFPLRPFLQSYSRWDLGIMK